METRGGPRARKHEEAEEESVKEAERESQVKQEETKELPSWEPWGDSASRREDAACGKYFSWIKYKAG